MNVIAKKIASVIRNTNINILVYGSFLIPVFIYAVWFFIINQIFSGDTPKVYYYLHLGLGCVFFLWGMVGVVQVIKRETMGIAGIPIRGTAAVISGIMVTLLFWSFGTLMIFLTLNK